jgi:hypothetical protein
MSRRGGLSPVEAAVARVRRRAVFINCPYDDDYRAHLEALIFAVVSCRFNPRSAVEFQSSDERMTRIRGPLRESELSIHDLSRYRSQERDELARFNMPFELGMAFEMRSASRRHESELGHEWLVLAPSEMPFKLVLSDLAGYDPVYYSGRANLVETVVTRLLAWRETLGIKGQIGISPGSVAAVLGDFEAAMQAQGADPRRDWARAVATARAQARLLLGAPEGEA